MIDREALRQLRRAIRNQETTIDTYHRPAEEDDATIPDKRPRMLPETSVDLQGMRERESRMVAEWQRDRARLVERLQAAILAHPAEATQHRRTQ